LSGSTVDSFTPPATYAVNGVKTNAEAPSGDGKSSNGMPPVIMYSAIAGGLTVFAGAFYYSR
jgi:hypothetical protein